MIKLTFCLHRLPHLSREEFQTYWRETHAPLVAARAETLAIKRYVQTHTEESGMNAAVQNIRGGPDGYDGVAELWFDSFEAIAAAADNEGAALASAELLEDERKFIDLARSPLWFSQEHVIVG